jgi:hypothetical protein
VAGIAAAPFIVRFAGGDADQRAEAIPPGLPRGSVAVTAVMSGHEP